MIPWLAAAGRRAYDIGPGFVSPKYNIFSRAQVGSQSTATGPDGATVQYYGADAKRFHLAPRWFWQEGQFTAQTPRSNDFSLAWTNDAFVQPVQDQGLGPDGVINSWRFNEGTGPTKHSMLQTIAVGSGADALVTAFLKYVDRRYVNLNLYNGANFAGVQVDCINWTVATYQLGTGLVRAARIVPVANGHYMVQLIGAIPAQTSYNAQIVSVNNAGENGDAFNTFGLNYGAWAMSAGQAAQFSTFVPTTSAALTRGPDVCAGLLSNFGVAGVFTSLGVAMLPRNAPAGIDQTIDGYDDATDNNRFTLRNAAGGASLVLRRVTAGAGADSASLGNYVAGTPFRYAVRHLGGGAAEALLEGGSWQAVSGGPTSLTHARLGGLVTPGAEMFGGHGRKRTIPVLLSQSAAAAAMAAIPLT